MAKARRRTAKVAQRLTNRVCACYAASPLSRAMRRCAIEAFVGWAYAHGHDLPRSKKEFDAMQCTFELFLFTEHSTWSAWQQAYKDVCTEHHNRSPRACRWWVLCKLLSAKLPTLARKKHWGTDAVYTY
jgi:hypothetical protein